MATTPTLYPIDIVEQQELEQPRILSVDIVEVRLPLNLPMILSVDIVEVRLPLNLPLIFDVNISWVDYIKNDSNAFFAFSGL